MGKRKWHDPHQHLNYEYLCKIVWVTYFLLGGLMYFFSIQFPYIAFIIREKPPAIFFLFFKDAVIYKTINPNFLNKYMQSLNSNTCFPSK